jgi:hypothetical protein
MGTSQQQMVDAAFATVLDAVRERPDEVVTAIGKFNAEFGPGPANALLDRIEQRLGYRLPEAIRDAASTVKLQGHA